MTSTSPVDTSMPRARSSSQALAKAAALRGAPPLRRGGTEPTLPIASGVLLKRGRKLAQWTPRWYAIDVGGTMVCHKSREDVGKRTPLWSAPLGGGKVTLLPFERLEQELRGSGLGERRRLAVRGAAGRRCQGRRRLTPSRAQDTLMS